MTDALLLVSAIVLFLGLGYAVGCALGINFDELADRWF